jgi:hypothetical protein
MEMEEEGSLTKEEIARIVKLLISEDKLDSLVIEFSLKRHILTLKAVCQESTRQESEEAFGLLVNCFIILKYVRDNHFEDLKTKTARTFLIENLDLDSQNNTPNSPV